jgi:predicted acyltransferase
VLYAAGWTLLALAICYFVIEIKKQCGAWTYPWKVFGSNAIFSYALSELLASTLDYIQVGQNGHAVALKDLIYTRFFSPIASPSLASLLYSLCFVLVCFAPAFVLYRKGIFLKV